MPAFSSDADLLRGLQARDNTAYAQLYAQHYPAIERHVRRHQGSAAAAQDVFQETLLVLLARLDRPGFELTAALKTYVFAVASQLWLKQLRAGRRWLPLDDAPAAAARPAPEPEADEAPGRVRYWLARLTARCQLLLRALFLGGQDIRQLTQAQGYTTVHNAQNQKYKCLEQARRRVMRSPGAE